MTKVFRATGGAYGAGRYSYSTNLTSSKRGATTEGTAAWSDVNYINQASASVAAGDVVTLTFTASETITNPVVTFKSGGAAITDTSVTYVNTSGTTTWTAAYTVNASDTSGAVTLARSDLENIMALRSLPDPESQTPMGRH